MRKGKVFVSSYLFTWIQDIFRIKNINNELDSSLNEENDLIFQNQVKNNHDNKSNNIIKSRRKTFNSFQHRGSFIKRNSLFKNESSRSRPSRISFLKTVTRKMLSSGQK